MSTDAVAATGFVSLFALMLLRVPVGIAMGLVGVLGFGYLIGDIGPALKMLAQSPIRTATDCRIRRHSAVPADGRVRVVIGHEP